ncbi:hypothetical protein QQ045_011815 [Rhodiola kirilowii]
MSSCAISHWGWNDSGVNFIWVIKRSSESGSEDYLPEGFEDRVEGRGQRACDPRLGASGIDFGPSVGWGICDSLRMEFVIGGDFSWLAYGDVAVVRRAVFQPEIDYGCVEIGVEVGVEKCSRNGEDRVTKEKVEKAVRAVMIGEETEERRGRARQLKNWQRKLWRTMGLRILISTICLMN